MIKTKKEIILEELENFGAPLKESCLMEMANIDPLDHNFGVDVKLNIFQPGDKKLKHGPRVKVFRGSSEYYIALNMDVSKIKSFGNVFLNNRDAKIVFNNIVKCREAFLDFWNDSQMTTRELLNRMSEIRKAEIRKEKNVSEMCNDKNGVTRDNFYGFGIPIEEEFISEMANLGPRMHKFGVDVKIHLMQPGDRKLKHGPRVKVFRGSLEYIISLNSDPFKMRIDGKVFLNNREAREVFDKVVKYQKDFLAFWNDPSMTVEDLLDMMERTDDND